MKRIITALTGGTVLALIGFAPVIAQASTAPGCALPTGFYVNDDETDRAPTPVAGGLQFSGNDLIHHATTGTLETLVHGSYVADPAPDQPSFFSVEVSGDGKYGTLRWNTTESYWEATSQGEQHHDTDPAALADAFPVHLSHHLMSFGVGYTNTPPGTVTTVVSGISFAGQKYDLTCVTTSPSPSASSSSASPSPSATVSHTASPSASTARPASTRPTPARSSSTPAAGGSLPITGPSVPLIVGAGAALLLAGFTALYLAHHRRKVRFTA